MTCRTVCDVVGRIGDLRQGIAVLYICPFEMCEASGALHAAY